MEYKTIYINNEPTKYVINQYGDIINTKSNKHIKIKTDPRFGRRFATLSHKGVTTKRWLSRWILLAFNPLSIDDQMLYDADHKDGDKTNDVLSNLQWLNKRDNIIKSVTTDGNNGVGENNNNSKITDKIAESICRHIVNGYSDKCISEKLNVSVDIIQRIKHNQSWTHISSNYKLDNFINKRKPYKHYTKEFKLRIHELLEEDPNLKAKKLSTLLNVEYDNGFKLLVQKIKYSMKEQGQRLSLGGETPQ